METKLSGCDKEELLRIIDCIESRFLTDDDMISVLKDVAKQYADIAQKKQEEAFDFMRKHDGKPPKDIPMDDVRKGWKCLKESGYANRSMENIMAEIKRREKRKRVDKPRR